MHIFNSRFVRVLACCLPLMVLALSLPSTVVFAMVIPTAKGGKCTGKVPCPACSNCSRCAHCSAGGTCGACIQQGHVKTDPQSDAVLETEPAFKQPAPMLPGEREQPKSKNKSASHGVVWTKADSLKKGLEAKSLEELIAEIRDTTGMVEGEPDLTFVRFMVGDAMVQCPPQGNSTDAIRQKAYAKKARYRTPRMTSRLAWHEVFGAPDDMLAHWKEGMQVEFTAYAVKIFLNTKGEGCNCSSSKQSVNSSNDSTADTRIYLTLKCSDESDTSSYMLGEVSPRVKALRMSMGDDYTTAALKTQFQGRWVRVKGYLFYDFEHDDESTNNGAKYKSGGTKTNRITGWELHPLISIELADEECP